MVWFSPVRRIRNVKRRVFRPIADYFWLSLDFVPPERPVIVSWIQSRISPPLPFSIAEFRQILERLAKDKYNKGLILEVQTALPFASTRSIMDHLMDFREQDREIITFATNYSLYTYWLASVGSQVTVQNQGTLMINGLYSNIIFMADFLKKYGFQLEKMAVSPYKSALDNLARNDITPEAKENRKALYISLLDQIIKDIARNRGLSEDYIQKAIDQAPLTPEEALDIKLIDRQVSAEELPRLFSKKSPKIRSYAQASKGTLIPPKPSMKKVVAIIPVQGIIIDGKSREIPKEIPMPLGEKQAGDHTIVPLIRKALTSSRIAAAILCIDSPGGSISASESIRLALQEFASKKPLVAYFNNVAASGGYYIAAPAHYIVAQPQTITGSIGVLSAKFNFQDFLEKNQLKTVEFKIGKRADWLQPTKPLTDEERLILRKLVFYHYDHFLDIVAEGRKLDREYLETNLAGGRIWTGAQALERKLVDQIGNMQTALNKAKKLAKLKPNSGVITLRSYRRSTIPKVSLLEYLKFFQSLTDNQMWMIELDIPSFSML